jgi:guanosine-3',5'-bis(diphosphate) 3'-pyrophosphohydrolase
VLLAAILHDTVEDTDTTFEEIESNFGRRVREIVEDVTDDKTLPKEERKRLQVVNAPHKSREAKLVKLADKLYNLRCLVEYCPVGWTQDRRKKYFEWAEQVCEGLWGVNPQLEEKLKEIFEERRRKKKS